MFDTDKWQEIFSTIRKNKLRTFLTALSVAWGIFVLVVLMGVGKGMQNGVLRGFDGDSKKTLWIWQGVTSLPHAGLQPGRQIHFRLEDYEAIDKELGSDLDFIGYRDQLPGQVIVNYKTKNPPLSVYGSNLEFFTVNGEKLLAGRFLNEVDLKERRKVAFIGEKAKKLLFGDSTAAQDILGEYVSVKNVQFKIVGVYKLTGGGGGRREERLYMPITTYQAVFEPRAEIEVFGLQAQTQVPALEIEEKVKKILASRHRFDPADTKAIGVWNNEAEMQNILGVFKGIELFIWVVSIMTLLAGIVGVSNIMLIIVKERTREIGIRKAIGATPFSIVSLIIQESVFITTIAGYFGLLAGVAVVDGIRQLVSSIEASGGSVGFFSNPEVDLQIAGSATVLLILAGAIAGFYPAIQAAKVKPVEALKAD